MFAPYSKITSPRKKQGSGGNTGEGVIKKKLSTEWVGRRRIIKNLGEGENANLEGLERE